jgi:hypothetical protein
MNAAERCGLVVLSATVVTWAAAAGVHVAIGKRESAATINPTPSKTQHLATVRYLVDGTKHRESNAILDPAVIRFFPATLRSVKDQLALGLEVTSPVKPDGDFIFGEGCRRDMCDAYQAAWTVDRGSGSGAAILMVEVDDPGISRPERRFVFFGQDSKLRLPGPLASWGRARGMNQSNLRIVRPSPAANWLWMWNWL